jgi:hypothetical protein
VQRAAISENAQTEELHQPALARPVFVAPGVLRLAERVISTEADQPLAAHEQRDSFGRDRCRQPPMVAPASTIGWHFGSAAGRCARAAARHPGSTAPAAGRSALERPIHAAAAGGPSARSECVSAAHAQRGRRRTPRQRQRPRKPAPRCLTRRRLGCRIAIGLIARAGSQLRQGSQEEGARPVLVRGRR